MKKILLFLAASAFVVSCNNLGKNEYEITGKIDPSLNGKNVFLEEQGGMLGFTPTDTAKVVDGKFVFKGTVTDPSIRFIQVDGVQGKTELILENGKIAIEFNKDSVFKSKQSGTYNNDKLRDYYDDINKTRKKMVDFQKKHQPEMMAAYQSQDTVVMNRLNKDYSVITDEMTKKSKDFIKNNPKAFISVLLVKQMAAMQKDPIENIKKLYDNLSSEIKKTKEGKEVGELFEKTENAEKNKENVQIGKIAPDFTAPNPEGQNISLKESLGKVTVIDFWASWCKPCRIENPNVVAMYNELHSKGLNIIGVSLDQDGDKWKEAIVKDKLTWSHVSNLKHWEEPIAIQYGITGIPATLILDAQGKIVAKDLRGAQLKAKVQELLDVK